MTGKKAAVRYARAMYSLGEDENVLEMVLKDMELMENVFRSGFRSLDRMDSLSFEDVYAPAISDSEKQRFTRITQNLLVLLKRRRRLNLLPLIPSSFINLYNSKNRILNAVVRTAVSLSNEHRQILESKLIAIFKATKINMTLSQDESLIAGIQIQIGDTLINANVQKEISRLRQLMAA